MNPVSFYLKSCTGRIRDRTDTSLCKSGTRNIHLTCISYWCNYKDIDKDNTYKSDRIIATLPGQLRRCDTRTRYVQSRGNQIDDIHCNK